MFFSSNPTRGAAAWCDGRAHRLGQSLQALHHDVPRHGVVVPVLLDVGDDKDLHPEFRTRGQHLVTRHAALRAHEGVQALAQRPPCIVCRTWHQTQQTSSVSPQQTRTTQAALIAQARADVRQAEKERQAALRARQQGQGTVGAYGRAKQKVETCLRRLRRLERKRGVP
jgi:hypothetical protein